MANVNHEMEPLLGQAERQAGRLPNVNYLIALLQMHLSSIT